MIDLITTISLWELTKHTASWLTNLKRAKNARKKESITALRKVILAARTTSVYLRQLNDTSERSHKKEGELAILWTELSFALEDLGVDKLAKRCRIKGKDWEDPTKSDKDYLKKADISLDRMEQMANQMLNDIKG